MRPLIKLWDFFDFAGMWQEISLRDVDMPYILWWLMFFTLGLEVAVVILVLLT